MRQRQTHTGTVYGEVIVGKNVIGTPMTETNDPIIEFPCRLESTRNEIKADETGQRIDREPYAIVPVFGSDPADPDVTLPVMEHVSVGDDMVIEDRWVPDPTPYRIVTVGMQRGRGNAPRAVRISLAYYGLDEEPPGGDI